jgi:hypothetical protein
MTVLVDGHNLIGKIPDLSLDDPDDEEKLLIRLRSYRARTGKRLAVYFDPGVAYRPPAEQAKGGLRVRYARAGQHADELIIRYLRRHRNPRELTVVTSDRRIQAQARLLGARVVDSSAFAAELSATPRQDDAAVVPSLSEDEVQEWLEIFGKSDE